MPPKYVKTVEGLIYWEYAKLIARAAGFEDNYGFITSRYKKLESGEMEWSSSIRDREKEWEHGQVCVYCGSTEKLAQDHIIPSCRGCVDSKVRELLESGDNCVWACQKCNSAKGARDVFEWYGKDHLDEIPKLVLSKFLKLSYRLHETQGTLRLHDPNMDGVLDIYDLGVVITYLISKLSGEPDKPSDAPEGKDTQRSPTKRKTTTGKRSPSVQDKE
jgi:hypothetical protein